MSGHNRPLGADAYYAVRQPSGDWAVWEADYSWRGQFVSARMVAQGFDDLAEAMSWINDKAHPPA